MRLGAGRFAAGFAFGVGASAIVNRISRFSGATREEAEQALPGDDVVPHPSLEWTRAITIDASPADIWPWLLQMGYGRGGFFAPAWVDELIFRVPNTNRDELLPDEQRLEPDEIIADGPEYRAYWHVKEIVPQESVVFWSRRHPWRGRPIDPKDTNAIAQRELELLVSGVYLDFSWAFVLRELVPGRTRLLLRTRGTYSPAWLGVVPLGLADAYLGTAVLKSIKDHVETKAATVVRQRPLPVHFAEQEPNDENLANAALLKVPGVVFLAAETLDDFRAARERLRKHNPKLEAGWWVMAPKSVTLSRFADAKELDALSVMLQNAPERLRLIFDFEVPFWAPGHLARPRELAESARAMDQLLAAALRRHEVWTSEWPAPVADWPRWLRLRLPLAHERTYQLYSTMMPKAWRRVLRGALARRFRTVPGGVGIGTLSAPEGYRNLTPEELERDLKDAAAIGARSAMVYRLAGLTQAHAEVINRFAATAKVPERAVAVPPPAVAPVTNAVTQPRA